MRRRRVSRIERILRRINRLLPTFQEPVPQHPFDKSSRHLPQPQKLRQRQRPALRLQQFADAFLSALPLRTLSLWVIFFPFFSLFLFLFFFLFFFLRQFLSRSTVALPRDHPLRPALSSLQCLPNFNESAPLQPLQRGSVHTQFRRWTERQCSFLLFQLREKRRLLRREPVRQFTAAQALRRCTPRLRQNNLALRFQFRHRRQHRAKHFAHRCQVIPRDPVRQLDQFRRQRRNKIQHARDLANFRALRRALRQSRDDADHRFLPERHEHA